MSYVTYKTRPKTPINFYGYSRNLSKKRIQTERKFDNDFDALEYIFQTVKSELDKKRSSLHSANKLSQKQKQRAVALDLNADGETQVALVTSLGLAAEKFHKKENHVLNYAAIKEIVTKLGKKLFVENDEYLCEVYRERINNLNGYVELSKFCFKYLGKSGADIDNIKSDFFKIVSKNPIEITIQSSKVRYKIEDVLAKYFKYISEAAQENSEHEV